jgi:hypothetical protein
MNSRVQVLILRTAYCVLRIAYYLLLYGLCNTKYAVLSHRQLGKLLNSHS